MREYRIATRGSLLAMAQAEGIRERLEQEGISASILVVETKGDKDRVHALQDIGGDGLFVRSIERALLEGQADIAVHCGKDLPYDLQPGLVIAGVPEAEEPFDCLVCAEGASPGSLRRIGTGSPRRISQLEAIFPEAQFIPIRGNINTRVGKIRRGEVDAVILAQAGIRRLQDSPQGEDFSLEGMQVRTFSVDEMLPAACQGILALECRADDAETRAILERISDPLARERFDLERAVFTGMKADCRTILGANAKVEGDTITLSAVFAGKKTRVSGNITEKDRLVQQVIDAIYPGNSTCRGTGFVTLVGAGCGEGLITVKGVEALRHAQVLVYDDLIDDGLLKLVPAECILEYVGKRYGAHSRKQEEINRILVDYGQQGYNVVRLKGGDSFVFGRGGEEVLALQEAGIPFELIPGVSSSIAVPECAGLPVTHRGVARSFCVITGQTKDGTGEDYRALAALQGTLVFLMGLHAYPEITARLMEYGKSKDTPASVISRGCSPQEQRIDGTLENIAALAADAPTPAILVVGQTAGFHMKWKDEKAGNLDEDQNGSEVTVTGTAQFVEKTARVISEAGFRVRALPTIEIVPTPENIPEDLSGYGWLVFTSANGINIFFETLRDRKVDVRTLAALKIACIGSGTAEKIAEYGILPDFIPTRYSARALGEELGKLDIDRKILILRADNGSAALTEELEKAGGDFEDRHIYTSRPIRQREDDGLKGHLETDAQADSYIVFGSAAGVRTYLSSYEIGEHEIPVCIGVYTAKALPGHLRERALVSSVFDAQGILDVISSRNEQPRA